MYNHGIRYKTDKITHHGYERFYDYFLTSYRNKHCKFLEIGVDKGRSLKMWNDFFTNAKIYGVDIGVEQDYAHPKGVIYKGDQSKLCDLERVLKNVKECDIIIDDGSHVPEHQLLTFNYYFEKLLNYGGVYIIEDIETSYWKNNAELYGYVINAGYEQENNIVEIFKNIVDIVNREFLLEEHINYLKKNSKIKIENLKYISFVMFGANCIIVKKMTLNEYNRYGERKYRFVDKL